jgi:transforming growth factor-beta-induced protein
MSRGVISAQSLNTLVGEPVSVRIEGNNIYVNDAQVIALNIPATNGVIHMINGVLTPPSNP